MRYVQKQHDRLILAYTLVCKDAIQAFALTL